MKDLNYYKSIYICGMKLEEIKTLSWKPIWRRGRGGRDSSSLHRWNETRSCLCVSICARPIVDMLSVCPWVHTFEQVFMGQRWWKEEDWLCMEEWEREEMREWESRSESN